MQTPHTEFPQPDPAGSAAAEQGTMPVTRSEFERLTAAEQDQLIGVAVDAVSKRLTELNNDGDGVWDCVDEIQRRFPPPEWGDCDRSRKLTNVPGLIKLVARDPEFTCDGSWDLTELFSLTVAVAVLPMRIRKQDPRLTAELCMQVCEGAASFSAGCSADGLGLWMRQAFERAGIDVA